MLRFFILFVFTCFAIRDLRRKKLTDTTKTFLQVFLVVLVVNTFVFQIKHVETPSMQPTIQPGDWFLVNPVAYGINLPFTTRSLPWQRRPVAHGDIVATRYPPDPDYTYVKRVVAVAGDTVRYRNGSLYVNGVKAGREHGICRQESIYLAHFHVVYDPEAATRDIPELVVPPGHVFLLGDNRDHSQDSRYWGAVPVTMLRGKIAYKVGKNWPFLQRDLDVGPCEMRESDFVRITDYYLSDDESGV